jgi:hypothetical protein
MYLQEKEHAQENGAYSFYYFILFTLLRSDKISKKTFSHYLTFVSLEKSDHIVPKFPLSFVPQNFINLK